MSNAKTRSVKKKHQKKVQRMKQKARDSRAKAKKSKS